MTLYAHPTKADVHSTKSPAVGAWLESRGYTPVVTADEAGELKGKALAAALDAAGLPKTGSADDQRARLAEHAAEQLEQQEEQEPVEQLDDEDELDPTDPSQVQ